MGRRSEHSRDELQELIISATRRLVQEHGAGNVTARQIAKAVGYTPGMLYSVFVNLQDIFLHVNVNSLETLYQACKLASEESNDPAESMLKLGLTYLRFAEQHTNEFDLLFLRMPDDQVPVPAILRQRINALFNLIEQELHTLSPDRDKHSVQVGARAIWSGVHGAAQLKLSEQLYLDSDHADRDIVTMLVNRFIDSWVRPDK